MADATQAVQAAQPGQPAQGASIGDKPRLEGWALFSVLIALLLTLLLAALDQTIVSTALPRIIGELNGFDRYTWVATAYLLTTTALIPIVGKLSDQFGRKVFLLVGVVIFLLGSALSGASQTMNQLIIFRGFQGIGAGILTTMVFTAVGDIFPGASRARWQGVFSSVFGIASVIGPTAGGWITENTSWRWVFYVNLPIGIIAFIALLIWLPTSIQVRSSAYTGREAYKRVDFAGALLAAAATVCLLLGLTWGGQTYPWGSFQVIGILVASGVLFVLFFVAERLAVEPILPLDLFKNRVFAADAVVALLLGMAFLSTLFYIPLFIQGVMGLSATYSGLAISPLTLALVLTSITGGRLISRFGRYQWLTIAGSVTVGIGVLLATRLTVSTSLGELSLSMVIIGLGLGFLLPVITLVAQNSVPRNQLGVATGAVTYLRSAGSTFGLAILGTVVNNSVTSELPKHLPVAASQIPPQALQAQNLQAALTVPDLKSQIVNDAVNSALAHAQAAISAQVPPGPQHNQIVAQQLQQVTPGITSQVHTLFGQIFEGARQSLAIAIGHGFEVGLIFVVILIVGTLFLKDVPLLGRMPSAQQASPDGQKGQESETVAAHGL
jgi:EmrB/QacA subfamily drug resistance transporter